MWTSQKATNTFPFSFWEEPMFTGQRQEAKARATTERPAQYTTVRQRFMSTWHKLYGLLTSLWTDAFLRDNTPFLFTSAFLPLRRLHSKAPWGQFDTNCTDGLGLVFWSLTTASKLGSRYNSWWASVTHVYCSQYARRFRRQFAAFAVLQLRLCWQSLYPKQDVV